MDKEKRLILSASGLIFAGLLLFFAVFFFWHRVSGTSSTAIPARLTHITVRLKWLHQTQFAGMYVADKKGFYRQNGIDATLLPFDYSHFPITGVASGSADFGVAGADEVLLARSQGVKVKALAVIYQKNPVVAYARASSGIKTPLDFVGKRLGMEKGLNVEYIVKAMIAAQNIDYNKDIIEVPIKYDATPLINGQVDIGTGYETNEPIQAEEAGIPVTLIRPSDYGVNSYADVLFTSDDMIKNRPALVHAFVDASLRGWRYALKHVDEAVNITLEYKDPNNVNLNFPHQKALLQKSVPLIEPSPGLPVGSMDYVYWRDTYDLLRNSGQIKNGFDFTQAYTTEFLK